jgi:hypothetical protein
VLALFCAAPFHIAPSKSFSLETVSKAEKRPCPNKNSLEFPPTGEVTPEGNEEINAEPLLMFPVPLIFQLAPPMTDSGEFKAELKPDPGVPPTAELLPQLRRTLLSEIKHPFMFAIACSADCLCTNETKPQPFPAGILT